MRSWPHFRRGGKKGMAMGEEEGEKRPRRLYLPFGLHFWGWLGIRDRVPLFGIRPCGHVMETQQLP